jgi:ribonucleoside-diphosphate reductase alpha chain
MRSGEYKVARAYVLYREERRKAREASLEEHAAKNPNSPLITMPDGEIKPLELDRLNILVKEACANLSDVDAAPILKDALRNLYSKANLEDVHKALIMAARSMVEKEPNYTYVSSRLLLNSLRTEALSKLGM